MTSGGQCVMTTGVALMLLWSAGNWDMHTLEVSYIVIVYSSAVTTIVMLLLVLIITCTVVSNHDIM